MQHSIIFVLVFFVDDHTRVKLRETSNVLHSDYINASFIVSTYLLLLLSWTTLYFASKVLGYSCLLDDGTVYP